MKRAIETTRTVSKSFLLEVARLGLIQALPQFIEPSAQAFVAALVLPPGAIPYVYVDAAGEIFAPGLGDYEISDDFSVVFIDTAKCDDLAQKFATAIVLKRTLFLLSAEAVLPIEFSLALDHHGVMQLPCAEHIVATVSKMGLGEIETTDAAFIASIPAARLRAAMTVDRPITEVVRRLRAVEAEQEPIKPERPLSSQNLALEDMVGFEGVKEWTVGLTSDVADWQAGKLPWSDVDRGAVFVGPPGTGKSKIAAAVAAACGMNFLSTSMARWQAKGHLGDFLAAMRADFKAAVGQAPCLLHLEELDSIGDRTTDTSDNSLYTRKSVNGFLEAVDEAFAAEGVVIVGSTNDLSAIDPAVTRSGRIERIFQVSLPTAAERLSILALHLRPHVVELPYSRITLISGGMSGADMERVAREAKRRARGQGRVVNGDDVLRFLPSTRSLDADEIKRTAVHEAGHAVVGLTALRHRLIGVTVSDVQLLGRAVQSLGRTTFERPPRTQWLPNEYRAEIAMLLGGIAAEELVFDSFSDGAGGVAGSDLAIATDIATRMECGLGMGETLVSEVGDSARFLQEIRLRRPDVLGRVDAVLRDALKRADDILRANNHAFEDVVAALVEHLTLPGEFVTELVETAPHRHRGKRSAPKRTGR